MHQARIDPLGRQTLWCVFDARCGMHQQNVSVDSWIHDPWRKIGAPMVSRDPNK